MRLSLIRFQLVSVLCSWALFILIIILYFSNSSWSQEKAKNDGVFLMYETLSAITPDKREEALAKIQDNFGIPFSIETSSQVESLWNIDVGTNRCKKSLESWKQRCPIKRLKKSIIKENFFTANKLSEIESEVTDKINSCWNLSIKDPYPDENSLLDNVFFEKK